MKRMTLVVTLKNAHISDEDIKICGLQSIDFGVYLTKDSLFQTKSNLYGLGYLPSETLISSIDADTVSFLKQEDIL